MPISLKRVGVMWHWRIGRLGGSVYLAKSVKPAQVAQVTDMRVKRPALEASLASLEGPSMTGNRYRARIAESLATGRRMAFLSVLLLAAMPAYAAEQTVDKETRFWLNQIEKFERYKAAEIAKRVRQENPELFRKPRSPK